MASVPSAGCLLARNQFYRTRYNSTSSTSSAGSSHDHITDHEKTPVVHGIHIPFEKCWLLKRFFHSENQPIVTEISSGSTPS
ncbi:pancreatic progenitor cell differentiation and proliferation factor-like protein [Acipenser ruthenus]|nr:pancreatic progenitor cell differentiation and proliferation factor-like protein [Acipenser ruthenus]